MLPYALYRCFLNVFQIARLPVDPTEVSWALISRSGLIKGVRRPQQRYYKWFRSLVSTFYWTPALLSTQSLRSQQTRFWLAMHPISIWRSRRLCTLSFQGQLTDCSSCSCTLLLPWTAIPKVGIWFASHHWAPGKPALNASITSTGTPQLQKWRSFCLSESKFRKR